ncbi:hypothetical protein NECAME_16999 [Necator americanus]|uniref:Uncharacterized protein n=1 Tax=Necator americanus TaxID=51031 RepID=W2TUV9_NECAM|nr:hypothetical protein NECAME_16999 [Necator americanus]ETN84817.1 hypothetical protein NECAME_16999 [Necator americanus]
MPTIHQKIHVRELNITVDSPKSNFQSYAGVDADLLNIGIATGAPLDLDSEGSRHPKTPFERLAVDYKERLTGAGDMDKFLKTIYSNAYIALVDAKEASSVRIPLIMRRAQAEFG